MLMLLNFLTFNNFILLSLSVKGAKMIVYTVYIVTIRGSRLLENENKKPEKLKKAHKDQEECYSFNHLRSSTFICDISFWWTILCSGPNLQIRLCECNKSITIWWNYFCYILWCSLLAPYFCQFGVPGPEKSARARPKACVGKRH